MGTSEEARRGGERKRGEWRKIHSSLKRISKERERDGANMLLHTPNMLKADGLAR